MTGKTFKVIPEYPLEPLELFMRIHSGVGKAHRELQLC